jgi:hypothetical protein
MQKTQLTLEQIQEKFQKDISAPLHECDLGSCQYSSVQASYEFALAYLKLNRAQFEEEMGISYTRELSHKEFIQRLKEICEYEAEDLEIKKPKIKSIKDYFDWSRDHSSDLWSASINPFENFKMDKRTLTGFQKTGFIINDFITQSESLFTGVELAYITYLFDEPMTTFAEFDT